MSTHLHIFFFPKKSRATVRKNIPIYLRVTVQGKRMEVTTNRFVLPNHWSSQAGMVKGKSKEAQAINSYLDYLRQQVYEYQQEILLEHKEVTIQTLREKWFGLGERKFTLLEAIGIHNAEMESLIGKDFKRQL